MSGVNPGIRAARAAGVLALYDGGDRDALQFVRVSETVHVVATASDVPDRYKELFGDGEAEHMMRMMTGEVWSICGTRIVRNRDGFETGGRLVSHFPDELLCIACHAAFGYRAVIIFEANQDDGEDPTQLGRLAGDLITKGQMLR